MVIKMQKLTGIKEVETRKALSLQYKINRVNLSDANVTSCPAFRRPFPEEALMEHPL